METLWNLLALNQDTEGWEVVAQQWLGVVSVIAGVTCFAILLWKHHAKSKEPLRDRVWGWKRSLFHLLKGYGLVLPLCLAVYFSNAEFRDIVKIMGAINGVFLGWTIYSLVAVTFDFVLFRDDYRVS